MQSGCLYVNEQEFSASSWRSNQRYTKMHGQPTIKIWMQHVSVEVQKANIRRIPNKIYHVFYVKPLFMLGYRPTDEMPVLNM